jgi:hypothetical protein
VRHIIVAEPQGSLIGGQVLILMNWSVILILTLPWLVTGHSHYLQMNVIKTCFMLFKNRRNFFGLKQALHVGGEVVREVQNYCYLRLQIDSDLNWHEHVRKTRMKILPIAFALRWLKNCLSPGFYGQLTTHMSFLDWPM